MSDADDTGGWLWAVIGFAALGWWLGWWGQRVQWTGYVYPNLQQTSFYKIGPFKTFEACQESAINSLRGINRAGMGDYMCGSNCKFDAVIGIDVCKETRK